jgi:phosphate transport system permease protein
VPIGVGVALYLTEYGKDNKFARVVRYFIDVMTGVPSIVFGLFIYITLVITTTQGYAAYKGSLALALLMFPVVVRSSEVVLNLVPDSLREAALALGAPRWRVTWRVVLRTAFSGLITGSLLAVARAAGETAPLLYVVQLTSQTSFDPSGPMNNVPFLIFSDIKASDPRKVAQAWGAALALVLGILALNLFARWIAARSRPIR